VGLQQAEVIHDADHHGHQDQHHVPQQAIGHQRHRAGHAAECHQQHQQQGHADQCRRNRQLPARDHVLARQLRQHQHRQAKGALTSQAQRSGRTVGHRCALALEAKPRKIMGVVRARPSQGAQTGGVYASSVTIMVA